MDKHLQSPYAMTDALTRNCLNIFKSWEIEDSISHTKAYTMMSLSVSLNYCCKNYPASSKINISGNLPSGGKFWSKIIEVYIRIRE